MRQTNRYRVVLAVLIGAFGAILLPYGLATVVSWLQALSSAEAMARFQSSSGFLIMGLVIALIFGVPIALMAIISLFGPVWVLLHRRGASLPAFMASAAVIQTVVWTVTLLFDDPPQTPPFWFFPTCLGFGALTGLLIWLVAYADKPRKPAPPAAEYS